VSDPRPCSAVEAVSRALRFVGNTGGVYWLGTGDYRPTVVGGLLIDRPYTNVEDHLGTTHRGTDCAGFALSYCYKLQRHRPGYNKHGAFDIEDDINSNSAIGDALGARDCFELATGIPKPGDLLAYPTFRLDVDGQRKVFIGHVAIVVAVRATGWDPRAPRYDLLDIAQSHGPNGFSPAVVRTDGSVFQHHLAQWPKPEHTVYLLRAVQ
jgi:hypothetical protein